MSMHDLTKDREALREWLARADLSGADVPELERSLLSALSKYGSKGSWGAVPIAPLADPVDIDEMVSDVFTEAGARIRGASDSCGRVYDSLVRLNNFISAELEAVDRTVVAASDDVQYLTTLSNDQDAQYLWVSDSFNETTFVDLSRTTALVDTDYGQVTLRPTSMASIDPLNVRVDPDRSKGLPGCSLLVLDLKNPGSADKAPEPVLEKAQNTNLGALYDSDAQTWFEMERNYIPDMQPLRRAGRAYVHELGAERQSVKAVTKDYDWTAVVTMPDGTVLQGEGGKGVPLAEFLGAVDPRGSAEYDAVVDLSIDVAPQEVSEILVNPMLRPGQGTVVLESLTVEAEGRTILVARDRPMGLEDKSTTLLRSSVLRRTGAQSVGASFAVPTNRPIDRVNIRLRGRPAKAEKGLAHPFAEEHIETKTTTKVLFVSSVSRKKNWVRQPLSQGGIPLRATNTPNRLLGGVMAAAQVGRSVQSGIMNLQSAASQIKGLGNVAAGLGKASAWLDSAKVVPWLNLASTAVQIFSAAFGRSTEKRSIGSATGFDVFDGYRAGVAIREVSLVRAEYREEAEMVTVARKFDRPVRAVGVLPEVSVPDGWSEGEWVGFYLSTDGLEWTKVQPVPQATVEASYVPEVPTDTVYLRAVFPTNPSDPNRTAKLLNYALQGIPA